MIKNIITYLNNKIVNLGYFNKVEQLAEKIEREGKVYPAIYKGNGEYQLIELDSFGSICYWRKNGDVTTTKQDNDTSIGMQYQTDIPLKLICFLKKEITSDQYFADNIANVIVSELTINNSALKSDLKAKRVTVFASRYVTDSRMVERDEYDTEEKNVDTIRYSHAYFSIDFNLSVLTSNQCVPNLCTDC